MFYRFILFCFLAVIATTSVVNAGDYEINLSVLDSISTYTSQDDMDLPYPAVVQKKQVSHQVRNKIQPQAKAEKVEIKAVETSDLTVSENKDENSVETTPVSETTENTTILEEKEEKEISNTVEQTEVSEMPEIPAESTVEEQNEKVSLEPIVPEPEIEPVATVAFEDESDLLTRKMQDILNDFSATIEKPDSTKILIEAYHYDNGENTFARKRLSLNRAVNIRSYLLNKGHKSFSIKIINVEDASLRNNAVVSY